MFYLKTRPSYLGHTQNHKSLSFLFLFAAMIFFSVMLISLQSSMAQAKGYLGGTIGLSVPNFDDTSARLGFGLIGGTRLDGELGLGAYYFHSAKEEESNGVNKNFGYDLFGIEGSFHFEGVADGAFVGLRVGTTKLQVGDNTNKSPTHFGFVFGFDKFVHQNFSLGVEGSWISVDSSSHAGTKISSFSALNFLAALKAWF